MSDPSGDNQPALHRDPWLITADLPCLDCGYNLRSLVGPVVSCPECGRRHNLAKPGQWAPSGEKTDLARAQSLTIVAFSACCAVALLSTLFIERQAISATAGIAFIIGAAFLAYALFGLREIIIKERRAGSSPVKILAGIFISLMVILSPFAMMGLLYLYADMVALEYQFAFFPGLLISIGWFLLLLRLFPGKVNNTDMLIPEWMRYCDAVFEQAVKNLPEDQENRA